jgi:phosphatidylglycerophosphatase A
VKKRITLLFATGFGLGLAPVASGTFGTLPGVALVIAMAGFDLTWQIAVALVLPVLAVPLCSAAEEFFRKKDDGRIVADEYCTFPLCMLGLPWPEHMWLLALGFVTHRVLDIIKPAPARQAQALTGGTGIVVDDVISSIYALAVNHLVWRLVVAVTGG